MMSAYVLNSLNVFINFSTDITVTNLALKRYHLKYSIHQENRGWILRVTGLVYLLNNFQVLLHHLHHCNIVISSGEKFRAVVVILLKYWVILSK